MRINVYSQELTDEVVLVEKPSNTGITYSAVQFILHSSEKLHHPPFDDDRIALAGARSGGVHAMLNRERDCVVIDGKTYCEIPAAKPVIERPPQPIFYDSVNAGQYIGIAIVAAILVAGMVGALLTLADEAKGE